MITQLVLDLWRDGEKRATAGTPVRLADFGNDWAQVELPDGEVVDVEAAAVSSGVHSPEETLGILSGRSGVREGTLLKAAQAGRLMARQSGGIWLSTLTAIDWAIKEGRIREPQRN
jgi:hypothetical protein